MCRTAHTRIDAGYIHRQVAFALASTAGTLSKFAADVCLYMSQNFNFISFPKELTTGSSIMPHKKNPDVFELIRAKCNKVQNLPTEIMAIINNLKMGYHLEYQPLKESFIWGIGEVKNCLEVSAFMLEHIQVKKDFLAQDIYNYLYTVEDVNRLVLKGIPFREAYRMVRGASLGPRIFSK